MKLNPDLNLLFIFGNKQNKKLLHKMAPNKGLHIFRESSYVAAMHFTR